MGKLRLDGQSFGRLTVLSKSAPARDGRSRWDCRCACGTLKTITGSALSQGSTRSCGCLQRETIGNIRRIHGRSFTHEYYCWSSARDRCVNPNNKRFHRYGGRGITMCEDWAGSFAVFFRDIGPADEPRMTLERIDNDRGYEPGNVRWATFREQANNTVRNHNLTYLGRTMSISAWEREIGVQYGMVKHRIHRGWSVEDALTKPSHWRPTSKA